LIDAVHLFVRGVVFGMGGPTELHRNAQATPANAARVVRIAKRRLMARLSVCMITISWCCYTGALQAPPQCRTLARVASSTPNRQASTAVLLVGRGF
jgi:hypothetical protein